MKTSNVPGDLLVDAAGFCKLAYPLACVQEKNCTCFKPQEEEQFEDISVCEKCNEASNGDVSDVF